MKLKMDDAGHAVVADGKPVYVYDDGKEAPFDAAHTLGTITRLNGEAKGHRERAEKAEGTLKSFEGIADPAAALKALETVGNLAKGDLSTAAQVEEIKREAKRAAEQQVQDATRAAGDELTRLKGERDKLQGELYGEKVGGAFSRSKFIADKAAVPSDLLQAMFGPRFKVEDGRIVGYDGHGNKIYSRAKPGEVADFEEALETLVDGYANRDSILKGTGSQGSGARGGSGGAPGGKTMTRAAFEALPPVQKAATIRGGTAIVD